MKKGILGKLMGLALGIFLTASVISFSRVEPLQAAKAEEKNASASDFTSLSGNIISNSEITISYNTQKGNGTTAPALNGGLRIYKPSSGTTGGYIEVESSVENAIKAISFTNNDSKSTAIRFEVDGVLDGSNTSFGKTAKVTKSDINATNIKFYDCGSERLSVNTISVTYDTSAAKTLESINVKTAPTKVNYSVGEDFDPSGLVITASYDSGDPEDITYSQSNASKFTFNPSTNLQTSNTSVTISYGGKSTTQAITVKNYITQAASVTLSDPNSTGNKAISIGSETILNTKRTLTASVAYTQGDDYIDGDGKVTWSTTNASVVSVNDGEITFNGNGSATITATSQDTNTVSDSITYTVANLKGTTVDSCLSIADILDNWSILNGQEVFAKGYIIGWYVTSGNKSYAWLADEANKSASQKMEVYSSNITYLNDTSASDYKVGSFITLKGKLSKYNSTYEFIDLTSSSQIDIYSIVSETISSISVSTQPNKTEYNVGDTFDPTGLKITVTYSGIRDNETITYDNTTASDFSFNPSLSTALTASDNTVTVTYGGESANISITIDSTVHTTAVEIQYTNGASVGATKTVALDEEMFEIQAVLTPIDSGDDISWTSSDNAIAALENASGASNIVYLYKVGEVTITATSGGKSDSFVLTIQNPSDEYLYSIELVASSNAITKYYAGENAVNTTGLSVTATFKSHTVNDYSRIVENFTSNITYELDRENGCVIARYNNSTTIFDLIEVEIFETERPANKDVTFDLTIDSTKEAATDHISWEKPGSVSVENWQGDGGTAANNYYPGTSNYTSTRFYKKSSLYVTAEKGYIIKNIEFQATTEGYADAFGGSTIDTDSFDVAVDATTYVVSVTPKTTTDNFYAYINNNCGFSSITVNVEANSKRAEVNGFVKNYIALNTLDPLSYTLRPNVLRAGECLPVSEGGAGYYDNAITAYASLSADAKEIFGTNAELADARARLIAWGQANGKTVTFDATTGAMSVSARTTGFAAITEISDSAVAIMITLITCTAVAFGSGLYFRKRKEA